MTGRVCDMCKLLYYSLFDGCRRCNCGFGIKLCDINIGVCICKNNIEVCVYDLIINIK